MLYDFRPEYRLLSLGPLFFIFANDEEAIVGHLRISKRIWMTGIIHGDQELGFSASNQGDIPAQPVVRWGGHDKCMGIAGIYAKFLQSFQIDGVSHNTFWWVIDIIWMNPQSLHLKIAWMPTSCSFILLPAVRPIKGLWWFNNVVSQFIIRTIFSVLLRIRLISTLMDSLASR